ncbi:MAG: DUF63 family protein [Candidatus ainarchaeum sp.]|nr:DUF63 family protein [Candidatus ainarchaeum sp.]MDD3975553.1 DUF63 family protein [Candidatus ainarchaeum sp.]
MNSIYINNLINFFVRLNLFDKGYTIYNTFLFSIIGIIIYFFIIYPYLRFKHQKINLRFICLVFCFSLIGSILRMFSQNYSSIGKIIDFSKNPLSLGFYSIYPNIFILLGLIFLILYELSLYFSKLFNISKLFFIELIVYFSFFILLFYVFINLSFSFYFFIILFFCILLFLFIFLIFKIFNFSLLKPFENKLVVFSQILDSITSVSGLVLFPNIFKESHILSSLILSNSFFLFVFFKIFFSFFLLLIINKFIKGEDENKFFKLFIIILGFSTGFRNILTIGLFVF